MSALRALSLRRRTASSMLVALATLVPAATVAAQGGRGEEAAGFTLTVRDSAGGTLAGAELAIGGVVQRSVSDVDGVFRLVGLVAGPATLRVRRLGYQPQTLEVDLRPGTTGTLSVTLAPIAQRLAAVTIHGTNANATGRLAGFYRRKETSGAGRFFTRDQIERANLHNLSDLFRRIPGMQVSQSTARSAVRMRGAGRSCWPLVWLDGSPLAAGEFDLDNIQPNTLDAMEVYSGPAAVPPEFMGVRGLGSCGVVVLWSRVGDRRPKKKKNAIGSAELAALVESMTVFTADRVDRPARQDSGMMVMPAYPDGLYATGVTGGVLAEFVVDTTGRVEAETFGVISTSHPQFTEAVRRALDDTRYIPAMHKGRFVRQVVQQPFTFTIDSTTLNRRREDSPP